MSCTYRRQVPVSQTLQTSGTTSASHSRTRPRVLQCSKSRTSSTSCFRVSNSWFHATKGVAAFKSRRCQLLQFAAASTSEASTETMQEVIEFLKEDLTHLFDDQGIDKSRYEANVEFMDPITKYDNVDGYLFNIAMLRRVFDPTFELHSIKQTGPNEVTTRWTMDMKLNFNPFGKWWSPQLLFTGTSIMTINPETGNFTKHVDTWDSIPADSQEYLSIDGVKDLIYQVTRLYRTPDLDTPAFKVLKRTAKYQVREYQPFVVAEYDMDTTTTSGSTGSTGSGEQPTNASEGTQAFNALAGYIFGGNAEGTKMKMTTPVFTQQEGPRRRMQFVVSTSAQSPAQLPNPNSESVTVEQLPGKVFGVLQFSGRADAELAAKMALELRAGLMADGVQCCEGYTLGQYNDPSTKPMFRRNEVLIELVDFKLE
mmetsp:Transcript_24759/g.29972  ORF Transcript_24759/g.29972 Transcript_24759/m.29972 type:complete len:425 (+) Transcript_24759:124-1398(+)